MCRWISLVSPAAFGVYLIHVHPQIWQYYMKDAYKSFGNLNAYLLPFAVLGTATVVFIVCVVIDLLRGKVFEILKVKESCQALMEKIGLS